MLEKQTLAKARELPPWGADKIYTSTTNQTNVSFVEAQFAIILHASQSFLNNCLFRRYTVSQ